MRNVACAAYARVGSLWALGVGAVISGHYSGWNFGIGAGGFGGMLIAALVIMVMYFGLIFSLAEMSPALPHTGGAYSFARSAMGPWGGFITGLAENIEYVLTPAVIVFFIGSYMTAIFETGPQYQPLWWLGGYIVFLALNLRGVELSFRVSVTVTLGALAVLAVYWASALPHFDFQRWALNIGTDAAGEKVLLPEGGGAFLPFGWHGVLAAMPFAVWLFLAIEQLPLAAEESHDPRRDMPKGLILGMLTLVASAFLTLFLNSGVGGTAEGQMQGAFSMATSAEPLLDGFRVTLSGAAKLLAFFAVVGLIASFHTIIFAYGRQIYSLSRAGYFPQVLSVTHGAHKTPNRALYAGSALGFAVMLVVWFSAGAEKGGAFIGGTLLNMAVFGAMISYAMQGLAFIMLRKTHAAHRASLPQPRGRVRRFADGGDRAGHAVVPAAGPGLSCGRVRCGHLVRGRHHLLRHRRAAQARPVTRRGIRDVRWQARSHGAQMNPRQVRTVADARAAVEAASAAHVKVGVFDIDGIMRGKYMSRDKFISALDSGFGFCDVVLGWDADDVLYDNVQYTGWHTGYPDAPVGVVPHTCRALPMEPGVLFFLGEFTPPADTICPRTLLRRVVERARKMGFEPYAGFEYEFFVFDETPESVRAKDYRNLKTMAPGAFGYSVIRNSVASEFYRELLQLADDMDFPIEGLHEETGPGVMEAAIGFDRAEDSADKAALFKTFAKIFAQRKGRMATFMAKWSRDVPGQSGHIHLSLKKGKESAFHDAQGPHHMSETMRHFVGGQQKLLPELLAMVAPTVNSYSRLIPGFWAPTVSTWGAENRTTALRVIPGSAKSQRVEYRIAAADANPYVILAAALGSGLYGIEHRIEPEAEVRGNAYDMKFPPHLALPATLWEAAQRLKGSSMAREWFGTAFVEHFAATREWEEREFRKAITDWELRRYFEII